MATSLSVRSFRHPDTNAVVALWTETFPDSRVWNQPRKAILRKLLAADGLFFVGELDGRIVATVLAGYDGVRGWIYKLAVAGDYRCQGVGRKMVEEAEQALLARGCPKVNLQILDTNREVVAFYERLGYAVENRTSMGKALAVRDREEPADPVPILKVDDDVMLSPFTWADKPACLEHLNTTDAYQRMMGMMPYSYGEVDADLWLSKTADETLERNHRRSWAIRRTDGELIGGIGFDDITPGEKSETGYWVAEAYWGRGIATRATRALCEFGFTEYRLQRIFAQTFAHNRASIRVLEKAGFVHEGTFPKHFFREGRAYDVCVYGRVK